MANIAFWRPWENNEMPKRTAGSGPVLKDMAAAAQVSIMTASRARRGGEGVARMRERHPRAHRPRGRRHARQLDPRAAVDAEGERALVQVDAHAQ